MLNDLNSFAVFKLVWKPMQAWEHFTQENA